MNSDPNRKWGGLLVRREGWALSWPGKLLVVLLVVGAGLAGQRCVYSFLAVSSPARGEYLVVEGWISTDGLKEALPLCASGQYRKVLVSGCQVPDEQYGSSQVTFADWGASKLKRLGLPEDQVQPVPCWVRQRDRTYHSAVAVRKWFEDQKITVRSIDLLSSGPHARRSRLMFEKAFGKNVRVGIIAAEVQDYDAQHWWRSSEGVREVVGEAIAYVYARCLFFAPTSTI